MDFIFNWQTLISAVIAGGVSLFLWWRKSANDRKANQFLLSRSIEANLIIVGDTHAILKRFIEEKLDKVIGEVNRLWDSGSYFVSGCFFPLFHVSPLETLPSQINTGSEFVDLSCMIAIKRSKDFAATIDELRQQFYFLMQSHRELSLNKISSPRDMNLQYKSQLENFKTALQNDVFNHNIPSYLKELVWAQVGLHSIKKSWLWWWRLKFGPSLRFFVNKKKMEEYNKGSHERIIKSLQKASDKRLQEIQSELLKS